MSFCWRTLWIHCCRDTKWTYLFLLVVSFFMILWFTQFYLDLIKSVSCSLTFYFLLLLLNISNEYRIILYSLILVCSVEGLDRWEPHLHKNGGLFTLLSLLGALSGGSPCEKATLTTNERIIVTFSLYADDPRKESQRYRISSTASNNLAGRLQEWYLGPKCKVLAPHKPKATYRCHALTKNLSTAHSYKILSKNVDLGFTNFIVRWWRYLKKCSFQHHLSPNPS